MKRDNGVLPLDTKIPVPSGTTWFTLVIAFISSAVISANSRLKPKYLSLTIPSHGKHRALHDPG
jgi:hypothetical protein